MAIKPVQPGVDVVSLPEEPVPASLPTSEVRLAAPATPPSPPIFKPHPFFPPPQIRALTSDTLLRPIKQWLKNPHAKPLHLKSVSDTGEVEVLGLHVSDTVNGEETGIANFDKRFPPLNRSTQPFLAFRFWDKNHAGLHPARYVIFLPTAQGITRIECAVYDHRIRNFVCQSIGELLGPLPITRPKKFHPASFDQVLVHLAPLFYRRHMAESKNLVIALRLTYESLGSLFAGITVSAGAVQWHLQKSGYSVKFASGNLYGEKPVRRTPPKKDPDRPFKDFKKKLQKAGIDMADLHQKMAAIYPPNRILHALSHVLKIYGIGPSLIMLSRYLREAAIVDITPLTTTEALQKHFANRGIPPVDYFKKCLERGLKPLEAFLELVDMLRRVDTTVEFRAALAEELLKEAGFHPFMFASCSEFLERCRLARFNVKAIFERLLARCKNPLEAFNRLVDVAPRKSTGHAPAVYLANILAAYGLVRTTKIFYSASLYRHLQAAKIDAKRTYHLRLAANENEPLKAFVEAYEELRKATSHQNLTPLYLADLLMHLGYPTHYFGVLVIQNRRLLEAGINVVAFYKARETENKPPLQMLIELMECIECAGIQMKMTYVLQILSGYDFHLPHAAIYALNCRLFLDWKKLGVDVVDTFDFLTSQAIGPRACVEFIAEELIRKGARPPRLSRSYPLVHLVRFVLERLGKIPSDKITADQNAFDFDRGIKDRREDPDETESHPRHFLAALSRLAEKELLTRQELKLAQALVLDYNDEEICEELGLTPEELPELKRNLGPKLIELGVLEAPEPKTSPRTSRTGRTETEPVSLPSVPTPEGSERRGIRNTASTAEPAPATTLKPHASLAWKTPTPLAGLKSFHSSAGLLFQPHRVSRWSVRPLVSFR